MNSIPRITIGLFVLLVLFFFASSHSFAQTTQNLQNLSGVNVDNLTDAQIRQIHTQITSAGLPESQIGSAAAARGMSATEVQKLLARISTLKDTSTPSSTEITPRQQIGSPASRTSSEPPIVQSRIFGSQLFSNSNITFEPNLRIPTPRNYIIGADDQILLDINGDNEASYKLNVSPEGTIRVEFAGIIPVSGLTVEQASARIRTKLLSTYPGIRSGKTTLAVTIGNIRSIKVTLTGEVTKPGTYTLSSLATVFNALYASGGPKPTGSFREIQVIRNNRVVAKLDAYNYLVKGYDSNNIRLQDQDVILIPVYKVHVDVKGEVKRQAIFEVLPGEKFSDVLNFAGGFSDKAYTASVKVLSNTDKARQVSDIESSEYNTYTPKNGDQFTVDSILPRIENRVIIKGAIFRPGQFELVKGLTLSMLINKAEGIKEDAFLPRGVIVRLRADNTTEAVAFDLGGILGGSVPDVALQREDIITISSIFDLRDQYQVSINGEIRRSGQYSYSEGMSLRDLILLAGGFTEGASPRTIQIARRIKNSDIGSFTAQTAEILDVAVDRNLNLQGSKFVLQPFDIVTIRNNTGFTEQRQVYIEGEVLHPGIFVLASKAERISDLVKRAGGKTPNAYLEGASLKRNLLVSGTDKNKLDYRDDNLLKEKNAQRLQASLNDSLKSSAPILQNNKNIGIDLVKILANPGIDEDLVLKEGDTLRIPQLLQTVKINGEVLYPVTAVYKKGKPFSYYVSQGGGFTQKALNRDAYVIYANGSVSSTRRFLFLKNYPKIKPGAEIFVPQKAEKKGISTTEIVALSTGLASLGAIILGVLNLSK